jgi:hypothetical protein
MNNTQYDIVRLELRILNFIKLTVVIQERNLRSYYHNTLFLLLTVACLAVKFLLFENFYSKSEEGKAFVHANCVFVHEAELSGRCNSSERKRPYSRVLYLVLFDTSLENESVTF